MLNVSLDLEVYMFVTFHKKEHNLTDMEVLTILNRKYGKMIPLDFAQSFKPKTSQIVHYLHQRNYSKEFIQEHLDISANTYYYHLKTEPKEFINPQLRNYLAGTYYYKQTYQRQMRKQGGPKTPEEIQTYLQNTKNKKYEDLEKDF